MSDNRTASERRYDEKAKAITNAEHIAWAKKTLARFPFRTDLLSIINAGHK